MKRLITVLIVLSIGIVLASCGKSDESITTNTASEVSTTGSVTEKQTTVVTTENAEVENMTITVNGTGFSVALEDNETAKAFAATLPVTLDMSELHGNEKYYYLDSSLPSNPQSVDKIHKGDVMLYGDNCIVIFYKDFSTSYTYTRIGHIENADSLDTALGSGDVTVDFN